MCRAISILKNRIRQELFEQYELSKLLHRRNDTSDEELWFDFADRSMKTVLLPVIHDGQLVIYEWGNRGSTIPKLPSTGWCQSESLEAGKWRWLNPERVVIPADFGLEKGVWFPIREGIEGIVVYDQANQPHVYMPTEPATHYYQVMTKHDRSPALVDETI
jgi:hypothetical protein